jgi:hypothetical protein
MLRAYGMRWHKKVHLRCTHEPIGVNFSQFPETTLRSSRWLALEATRGQTNGPSNS